MSGADPELQTERLLLRAPAQPLAAAVRDFQCRNKAHFAPWEPATPPDFDALEQISLRLLQGEQAFAAGTALRYWISRHEEPARVIGQIHLSQLARGPFQNAMLGYGLDQRSQGQGLMQEALQAVIAQAFGPGIWLHRLQAAVRPENLRSRALLRRLGFVQEGLSRRYLFINGGWRDHEVHALLNPAWGHTLAP